MARNPSNRVSPQKREIAERIRQVWVRRKSELGLTQTGVAERLGISQSALSQYLHGYVATNTDFVTKIASIMGVDPKELDPAILVSSAPRISLVPRKLLLRGGIMGASEAYAGQEVTVMVDESLPQDHLSIVVVDTDHYAPRYFIGEQLVLQHIKPSGIQFNDELMIASSDGLNELYRAGELIGDVRELMDALSPKRQLSNIQIFRFDGDVYRVVSRV